MSDEDEARDALDDAYARSEAAMHDEQARAARRARVMGVIAPSSAKPAEALRGRTPRAFGQGGWALAACVAGLGVIFTLQAVHKAADPSPGGQPTPIAALHPGPPRGASAAPPEAAVVSGPVRPPQTGRREATLRPPPSAPYTDETQPSAVSAPAPAPPPPASQTTSRTVSQTPPQMAFQMAPQGASRAPSPGASPQEALPAAPALEADVPARIASRLRGQGGAGPSPADPAAGLRAAAAKGGVLDIQALLDRGVPVDAADEDGDTPLMISITTGHDGAAALLFRRGARLDATNRAGRSAREMALATGDIALERSLGLAP